MSGESPTTDASCLTDQSVWMEHQHTHECFHLSSSPRTTNVRQVPKQSTVSWPQTFHPQYININKYINKEQATKDMIYTYTNQTINIKRCRCYPRGNRKQMYRESYEFLQQSITHPRILRQRQCDTLDLNTFHTKHSFQMKTLFPPQNKHEISYIKRYIFSRRLKYTSQIYTKTLSLRVAKIMLFF